jgi:hypothetical protein
MQLLRKSQSFSFSPPFSYETTPLHFNLEQELLLKKTLKKSEMLPTFKAVIDVNKKPLLSLVAHSYNLCYLRGNDWED